MGLQLRRRQPKKNGCSRFGVSKNLIVFLLIGIALFFTILNITLSLSNSSTSRGVVVGGGGNVIAIPSDAPHENSNTFAATSSHKTVDSVVKPPEKRISSPVTADKKINTDVTKIGVKCDDHGDCRGFFEYSGPNKNARDALKSLREVGDAYTTGFENNKDGRLIFFPKQTEKPEECTQEWKSAGEKWRSKGMSQYGEDMKIFETFFQKKEFIGSNRLYMEIGAHDGVRESNSRLFDLCLGWQGLLVEPNPRNYELMEKLRPNAHHLGLAPSCTTSDIVKFPGHRHTNAAANQKGATVEIHCGPLSYYLEQMGIKHIDFWSLDAVGSELNILKTVDFHKVQIDVIVEGSRVAEVHSFLQQKEYLLLKSVSVSKSDVYLHKSVCHRYDFPECQ